MQMQLCGCLYTDPSSHTPFHLAANAAPYHRAVQTEVCPGHLLVVDLQAGRHLSTAALFHRKALKQGVQLRQLLPLINETGIHVTDHGFEIERGLIQGVRLPLLWDGLVQHLRPARDADDSEGEA